MNNLQKLSQEIKSSRENLNLSLTSLANMLKIRPSLIESFEDGLSSELNFYHYNHLRRLCETLSIPFSPYKDCFKQYQTANSQLKQLPQITLNERTKPSYFKWVLVVAISLLSFWLYKKTITAETAPKAAQAQISNIAADKPVHHQHTVLDS